MLCADFSHIGLRNVEIPVLPPVKQMDGGKLEKVILPSALPLTPPAVHSHKLHLFQRRRRRRRWSEGRGCSRVLPVWPASEQPAAAPAGLPWSEHTTARRRRPATPPPRSGDAPPGLSDPSRGPPQEHRERRTAPVVEVEPPHSWPGCRETRVETELSLTQRECLTPFVCN